MLKYAFTEIILPYSVVLSYVFYITSILLMLNKILMLQA